jgi:hypothetical protein
MDYTRFKEVVTAFADEPSAVHFERASVILQVQGEVIAAKLSQKEGQLWVEENEINQPAERWVATRLAQLDQLANSVVQMLPTCDGFITSQAKLFDQLEFSESDGPVVEYDALAAMGRVLERRLAGMCSVLYVTSDAGEGKTTLINQLAIEQARRYRERTTDWLIVPVGLGGSPFLRLDNVIAAALLNQLRFRRLYYEAFIQLVRLGFIVLALDGFEEVFVETAGDAASSLGNLISDLKGEGTLLVAARTAYFDFKSLNQQARLIDLVRSFDVGFAKLSLERWGKVEFLDFCLQQGIDGHELYDELVSKLGATHPLLTRAVFVRRLVELEGEPDSLDFLAQAEDANDLFHPFINTILKREIERKWLDQSSGVAIPLLSLEEHHQLLELVAEEMWLNKRPSLPVDTCESLAEIFCDVNQKSPIISRQVKERLSSHALLSSEAIRAQISFDHDHFREFFLGELVGQYISANSQPDLRKLLKVEVLPNFSADIAVSYCIVNGLGCGELTKRIRDVAYSESQTSFVRENAGALTIRALGRAEDGCGKVSIAELTFPADSLSNRRVENVTFEKCFFQSTGVASDLSNVIFATCAFDNLQVEAHAKFADVIFSDCDIRRLSFLRVDGGISEYFDPRTIASLLTNHGASLSENNQILISSDLPKEDDEEIIFIRKLLTIFGRSLNVGERVLSLKFGVNANSFMSTTLPQLLELGLVEEVAHRGGGYQRNFRLGVPVSNVASSLISSEGSFNKFKASIKSSFPTPR